MTRPDRVIRYPFHEDPRPFRWFMEVMEIVGLTLAFLLFAGTILTAVYVLYGYVAPEART